MTKKKIIITVCVVVLLASIGSLYVYLSNGIEIELTQKQINEKLKQNFPIGQENFLFRIILSDPVVKLTENSDKIDFSLITHVNILDKIRIAGIANIAGKIDYNPNNGEFFIKDSEVRNIIISGIPEKYQEGVKKNIDAAARSILNNYPVYKLKKEKKEQLLAKFLLRSVVVKNKKLVISLGL